MARKSCSFRQFCGFVADMARPVWEVGKYRVLNIMREFARRHFVQEQLIDSPGIISIHSLSADCDKGKWQRRYLHNISSHLAAHSYASECDCENFVFTKFTDHRSCKCSGNVTTKLECVPWHKIVDTAITLSLQAFATPVWLNRISQSLFGL